MGKVMARIAMDVQWCAILVFLIGSSRGEFDYGGTASNMAGTKHPCFRECGNERMTCVYNFTVDEKSTMSLDCKNCPYNQTDCNLELCAAGGGNTRTFISVNGMLPGPSILVCEGDRVIVNVTNEIVTSSITIHWHGIHQSITPFSDGVPYVNQKPIQPLGGSFKYDFIAEPAGTHIWHGHAGYQEADGLFGVIIVRRNESDEVKALYDYDLPQHSLIIWHWYPGPSENVLLSILQQNGTVYGYGFILNGKAAFKQFPVPDSNETVSTPLEVFRVEPGKRYRFRVMNQAAIYCPVQLSIDNHTLLAIGSDSTMFEPVEVDAIMYNAGERYDFVLNANHTEGCFWLRLRAWGDCDDSKSAVHAEAYVCYGTSEPNNTSPTTYWEADRKGKLLNPVQVATYNFTGFDLVNLTDLNDTGFGEASYNGTPAITYYIQVHAPSYNDYVYPGPWQQFNNNTFKLTGESFLRYLSSGVVEEDLWLCTEKTRTDPKFCQGSYCTCSLVEPLNVGELVEVVLVDISWDRYQDHPVHLHGQNFNVVSLGFLQQGQGLEDIKQANENGTLPKKLYKAISKDAVSVPNRGYIVLRFRANTPGEWLFHCHVTNHAEMGMIVVFQTGSRNLLTESCKTVNKEQCADWFQESGTCVHSQGLLPVVISILLVILFK